MTPRSMVISVVCATVLVAAAGTANAQAGRPGRPYRGLFGGGGVPDASNSLTVNLSLGGGYDTNVLLDPTGTGTGTGDPRLSKGSRYGTVGGGLNYSLARTRVAFAASASTIGRYYPDISEFVGAHSGAVGVSMQVSRNTRLSLNQSLTYQPYLVFDVFPQLGPPALGQSPPVTQDLGTVRDDYLTHQTNVDLNQTLSRRASLSLSYNYQLSDFSSGLNFSSQAGLSRFSYALGRGLALRLGYGYRAWRYPDLGAVRTVGDHRLDAGFDFARALSFSRRTTFSFNTGLAGVSDRVGTYYKFIGNARLNHEMGRTWNAGVALNREVELLERFITPILSNSVSIGVGGMINQRVSVQNRLSVAIGSEGVSGGGSSFDTYTAASTVTTALTRYLALSVGYSYYRYSFGSGALLPIGFPVDFDRHRIEATLNLWAPLLQRPRNSNAAR